MTLIQAQDRYIARVNSCHPGHQRRVSNAAARQLRKWAESRSMDASQIIKDAKDVAALERNSDE